MVVPFLIKNDKNLQFLKCLKDSFIWFYETHRHTTSGYHSSIQRKLIGKALKCCFFFISKFHVWFFIVQGYLNVWAQLKHSYARSLLFLFSISHVLIVNHPSPCLDISYIHLFRALDSVRLVYL